MQRRRLPGWRTTVRGVGRVLAPGLLLAGCAAARNDVRVAEPEGASLLVTRAVPTTRATDPERAAHELDSARRAAGLGRPGEAVTVLEALIAREPRYIPAHRLLQDLLVDSPGDWTLRRRYRLEEAPATADAAYLAARIEPDRDRQAALFARARALDPGHPWALVGEALVRMRQEDAEGAEDAARRAARIAPQLAMPWIFLGSLHLSRAEPELALQAYEEARARDPHDVRACLGLAAAAREGGDPAASAAAALDALRLAPGDPAVLAVAGDAIVDAAVPGTLRGALEVLSEASGDVAYPSWSEAVRAHLLLAAGDASGAREAADAALRAGAGHASVARVRRRAAVLEGSYVDAVESFLSSSPSELLAPDNLYGPRWGALRDAAAQAQRGASGPDLLALGQALLAVGWRGEAAVVLSRAQAAGPASTRHVAARLAARERAFDRLVDDLASMARVLRASAQRGHDEVSVEDVLAAVAAASRRRLGRDVTAGARVRRYPFLGEFAVSVGSDGAFARELDARGLLLLVGRRRGDGCRIVMGRLALVRADATARVGGHDLRFDECWLETDGLPRNLAGLGGGLAGLTMDRLVLVQLDTVLRGPVPVGDVRLERRTATARADLLALDTPSAVARRIEARLAAEGVLVRHALATVRHHELGHVLDAHLMLPVFAPPWRALALVLRHGLDGAAVEAHLEARAAVVALAEGTAPRAALASLLGFLPDTEGGTAHVRGYLEVVRRMVEEIVEDPGSFPSIAPGQNVLQQLDRLGDAEARELGRRLLSGM